MLPKMNGKTDFEGGSSVLLTSYLQDIYFSYRENTRILCRSMQRKD